MITDDLNLIRKIAWSYTRSTGMEFEELLSEACLAYLEAEPKYNPQRGQKSTFMYHTITNRLNNITQKEQRRNSKESSTDDWENFNLQMLSPEDKLTAKERWREILGKLSPEAKLICELVKELNLPTEKPKHCKTVIKTALKKAGWSGYKIQKTFHELKEVFSYGN